MLEINNEHGSLRVDQKLIARIAENVCGKIDGVSKLPKDRAIFPRGYEAIQVNESEDGQFTVDVDIIVDGVRPVVEVVEDVQRSIADELERHLRTRPASVNVRTSALA